MSLLVCDSCYETTPEVVACSCGCSKYLCQDCDERLRLWFDEAWRRWRT